MKYVLTLCCFATIIFACQETKDVIKDINQAYDFTEDSLAIIQVLNLQQSAWNNGNLEEFMTGYLESEELTFTGGRGVTYGWQNTLDNYKKGYPDKDAMGELKFEIIKLKSLGTDAAQLIGKFTLLRINDQPTGYFTLIFQKNENRWKITSDMTASSPIQD